MSKKIRNIAGVFAFLLLTIGATGCTQQDAEVAANVVSDSEPAKVVEAVTDARYTAYADSADVIGEEPVTLFFHADWCGTCVGLEKDINNNIDELPENAKILKVDFDTETELKKEYGILMQSTFVLLDKDGNIVEKLAAPTFDKLKDAIAASL